MVTLPKTLLYSLVTIFLVSACLNVFLYFNSSKSETREILDEDQISIDVEDISIPVDAISEDIDISDE